MATMTDPQIRQVRAEVGSTPSDDALQDLWDAIGASIPAVALAVLRPRLADALTAAAQGSVTVPGAVSIGAPAQPTMLLEQVQRLEATLAAETGAADEGALGGVVVMSRRTGLRGAPWLP
jgi:hypothetical protein